MNDDELLQLALEHHQRGDAQSASDLCRQVLRTNPQHAAALHILGCMAHADGDYVAACELFSRCVAVSTKAPEHPNTLLVVALAALAATLRSLHRSAEAIPYLQQALVLAPDDAELQCLLGDAYQDISQLAEAVTAYRVALGLNPRWARAWYALGCAELSRKEFAPAIECFEEALRCEPDWLVAEHNLARALFELGQTDRAVEHFRRCAARSEIQSSAQSRAMLALVIPGAPTADNAAILEARCTWAECDLPRAAPVHERQGHRPLRVGYVSSFFHRQNWMKPVWALINQHDRSEFEIHLFSDAPASRLQGYRADPRDRVHDITGVSNQDVSALIRRCSIDLLIDLNGYSDMARLPLFTTKPAPIIIGWFNLYATSGLDCFDYLIGDQHVIRADEERFYTERIRRVRGSCLTFDVNYPVPEIADPPCLTKRAITFGSLASQIKITSQVVTAWSEILRRSPLSTLIVRNGALGSASSCEFLYGEFAKNGVSRTRVLLGGPAEHFEFLKIYDEIDIALDTFPYNGGTTTTEAIWQGVPVVTFWGDRWVSRTSASILRAGGLGEFVRPDLDSYVSFAIDLANSLDTPERLLALRRGMRGQLMNSAVCDTETFAREMEAIYKELARF